MKYNDFLFYWLTEAIRKFYIKNVLKRSDKHSSQFEREYQLESAINNLAAKNKPITVKDICKFLNISPETLRNWGFLNKVKEYKSIQKVKLDEELKQDITQKAEELFAHLQIKREQITSDNLYKSLGKRRTVIVRKFPDLTQYLHTKLIENNRMLL